MKTSSREIKNNFLKITFDYMVKNGLEGTSIRNLCKNTGLPISSVYYWFPSGKDELYVAAVKFGLKEVADKLFEFAFDGVKDFSSFFASALSEVEKYKTELRFVYQMATSPAYGEILRRHNAELNITYKQYAEMLSSHLGFPLELAEPLVQMFLAVTLNFVIWGDKEKAQRQLNFIYENASRLPK